MSDQQPKPFHDEFWVMREKLANFEIIMGLLSIKFVFGDFLTEYIFHKNLFCLV